VSEMFAIYDTIQLCTNEVWTIGYGEILSAAGLLLACGDKRFATPSTFFMAHEMNSGVDEDSRVSTGDTQLRFSKKLEDMSAKRMAHHTGRTEKFWKDLVKKNAETWWGVEEMLKYGIIDKVWENK
jgi:ATP-dependent protease ClpP protease subunit